MPTTHYGTFPILMSGKTESVSRNGLKKISGTILFKSGEESAALSLAENFGSLFPEPTVVSTDMDLFQMSFNAFSDYGVRTQAKSSEIITISKSFQETITNDGTTKDFNWTISETYMVDSFVGYTVLPSNQASSAVDAFGTGQLISTTPKFLRRSITGTRSENGTSTLTITWIPGISNVSRRNFGDLDEADVTISMLPTIA